MSLSLSSIFSCTVVSSFYSLILYVILLFNKKSYINSKYLLLGMLFIAIRCFIPFEFFYTATVISKTVLPIIQSIGYYHLPILNISICQFLLYTWGAIAILKLIYFGYHQYRWEHLIAKFPSSKQIPLLRKIVKEHKIRGNVTLIEVPDLIIPAIIGLRNPKIIIPSNVAEKDLHYVLLHELEHYKLYDLYFIALLQLMCIIYWWNPVFYILKDHVRKMMEFRVDSHVTVNLNEIQKIDYLQSILNILKSSKNRNFDTVLKLSICEDYLGLRQRFDNVLYCQTKKNSYAVCVVGAISLFLLSTMVVIEPYSIYREEAAMSFEVPDGSYIMQASDNTYKLYVENQYCFTLISLEGFADYPVYKKEEKNK